RAAALLLESGRRSLARGALASAESAFRHAAELAPDAGPLAEDVSEALTEALSMSGKVEDALDVGSQLLAVLDRQAASPTRRGRICLSLARAAADGARWSVADEQVRRAAALAATADDPELTASI